MLLIILAGVFGGVKLDEWLELGAPVFTVVLSLLSVVLAIYYVTKDLLRTGTKKDQERKDKS
jgi:hypothetical protein